MHVRNTLQLPAFIKDRLMRVGADLRPIFASRPACGCEKRYAVFVVKQHAMARRRQVSRHHERKEN